MPIKIPDIMGKSAKITRVLREIRKVSHQDSAVMISGEKGRYKGLIARSIHDNSPRNNGPFLAANLSSIAVKSAEKELFGRDETPGSGIPTGGMVWEASGGTLFIEDISDLDLHLQDRLRSYLEPQAMETKGQNSRPDVRFICGTHKNIKDAVEKGTFRKGLYDMLTASHIKIPPLRERREDIVLVAEHFLEETVRRFDTGPKEFSKEAEDFLGRYDWPGDVRQLEDMVKRAALLCSSHEIGRKDLVLWDINCCSIKEFLEEKLKRYMKDMMRLENCNLFSNVLSEVERSLVSMVLEETGGNQLRAAKTLGINRNTLRSKIKEYKIRL